MMKRLIKEKLIDGSKLIRISKRKIEILLGEPNLKTSDQWIYIIEKCTSSNQLRHFGLNP
jgi:hypothetical protein